MSIKQNKAFNKLLDYIVFRLDFLINHLNLKQLDFLKELLEKYRALLIFIEGDKLWAVHTIGKNLTENLNQLRLINSVVSSAFMAKKKLFIGVLLIILLHILKAPQIKN